MRNKFRQVVLHGETLVFIATEMVANVAEVESRSTFPEICLQRGPTLSTFEECRVFSPCIPFIFEFRCRREYSPQQTKGVKIHR